MKVSSGDVIFSIFTIKLIFDYCFAIFFFEVLAASVLNKRKFLHKALLEVGPQSMREGTIKLKFVQEEILESDLSVSNHAVEWLSNQKNKHVNVYSGCIYGIRRIAYLSIFGLLCFNVLFYM